MWLLGKIWENMESSLSTRRSEEELRLTPNILTPHNIPEFCLPPRLGKRSPQPCDGIQRRLGTDAHQETQEEQGRSAPPRFSAEGYGLAGIRETPHTRRKESLLLSKRPAFIWDRRSLTAAPPRPAETTSSALFGFLPTSLSASSSSLLLPLPPPHGRRLSGATSCPSLSLSREEPGGGAGVCPAAPPCPLDVLQVSGRFQHHHVVQVTGGGKVRLSAEQNPSAAVSSHVTVRIRLVSVEDLRGDGDLRPLNCAVSLCLTPGKQQRQESATVRNCRRPVFNQDFFFPGLGQEEVMRLELRIKVLDQPASGPLRRRRRRKVMGVASRPLAQLLV